MAKLKAQLKLLRACAEAVEWVEDKTLTEAWATCERADWMLWLCERMAGKPDWPTRQALVLVACACAETVLEIFEKKYPKDGRPRKAIETARAWAQGSATIHKVRSAAAAAYAASAAAYADDDAASAAASDDDAASAASAAAASAASAQRSARGEKLKELAVLVRKELKIPIEINVKEK